MANINALPEGQRPPLLVVGLRAAAVALFVLLIAPFSQRVFLNWVHVITGVVLALAELAIAALLLVHHRSAAAIGAFSVALGGGLVAKAALPNWNFPYLLSGEIIDEVGFCWYRLEWARTLEPA